MIFIHIYAGLILDFFGNSEGEGIHLTNNRHFYEIVLLFYCFFVYNHCPNEGDLAPRFFNQMLVHHHEK